MRGATVVVVVGVLVAGPGTAQAGAAPKVRSWKVTQTSKITGFDYLGSVAVTGRRSAWAAGGTRVGGAEGVLLTRWNGKSWRRLKTPAMSAVGANVHASSDRNVWLFATTPDFEHTRVARWDGGRWRLSTIAGSVYAADVVSPANVWISDHRTLRHWNGRKWRTVRTPGEVRGLDLVSAKSGWAVGTAGGQPAAMRWDGTRWRKVATPRYTGPQGARSNLSSVLVLSSRDVWAVGDLFLKDGEDEIYRAIAMHWNGRKWSKVTVPTAYLGLTDLARDGQGGLWMRPGDGTSLVHCRAGRWTTVPKPLEPRSNATYVNDMAQIPDTTSMLGVGITTYDGVGGDDAYDSVYFATK